MKPGFRFSASVVAFRRLSRELEFGSFWRWVGLSVLVGVVAGLIAVLFNSALEVANHFVLGHLAGWQPPQPRGHIRLLVHGELPPLRRWVLWFLPAIGGLLSGALVFRFAPEAEGHGTDAMIHAFHHARGLIRPRVPIVKGLASVFTMGFGGSAGREGPITQMGGGFGSILATLLKLSDRERRILLLAGAAGGLGAIFRIPLGAALFAIEVLYRDGIEAEGIFPCMVSSVSAFSVFTIFFGQGHLFETEPSYLFHPLQLPLYAGLALACAPLGMLFIRLFYGMRDRVFRPLPIPQMLKPAVGGLALGVLSIFVPHVLGVGYGWVQEALLQTDRVPFAHHVWLAAAALGGLALAKMLATSLTISSGGSGGVFAPSMVIGGLIGASFGYVFHEVMPAIVPQAGAFVLVGMGCFMGGVSHVPFAATIMVCELTGSYDLLVPLMLANAITFSALRNHSLYEKQVRSPLESPAHLGDFTIDVLEDLRVADVCRRDAVQTVAANLTLRRFLQLVSESEKILYCALGAEGCPIGLVSLRDLRSLLAEEELGEVMVVADVMAPWRSLTDSGNLREALRHFIESGYAALPVVAAAAPDRIIGVLTHEDLINAYHREMHRRKLERGDHSAAHAIPVEKPAIER